MSEWTPKVGDKVMVGEHGPYRVVFTESGAWADLRSIPENNVVADGVPLSWLTPAPEPEPEEPTAPGALVRDGAGNLLFRSTGDASRWYEVMTPGGGYWEWDEITRPITVILADPAEVEDLRAERDAYRKAKQENDERFQLEAAAQRHRADELQRRIDDALRYLDTRESLVVAKHAASLLRGES